MPTLARNFRWPLTVLNRIYIIVGIFAIVVLGGAFLAPRFIEWSDYRSRMEVLASQMLGTPVTIRGKIDFALLPQPRLNLEDVLVGSPEEPAATVDRVVAEFSLMDFLRDNYHLTHLLLQGPVVDFTIDESGLFGSGVVLETGSTAIGLGLTNISNGTVRLMDRRSGGNHVIEGFDGELKLTNFSGPIQLQGAANYGGERYSFRFSSATPDAVGNARVSAYLQGANYSISSEGSLTPGIAPKYDGAVTFRQKPALIAGVPADDIRGDLVLESKLTASTDRIVLSGYTLQPDENRAGTRLTGAASVQLGKQPNFDAVVSGGVFALPPRDANEDVSQQPYELVRLLGELPAPMVPPMAGRVGVDLSEIGLRGFSLRDVRVDARTDGKSWQIENSSAQLPGNTRVSATGTLGREQDRPVFRGNFAINSARLEGLAQLWRKPASDNPLFGQPGGLEGRVLLNGDALGISNGVLTLAGGVHAVELRVGFGEERRLDVMGHFDALGPQGSTMLAALLPVLDADPLFGRSFPEGSFSLTGKTAQILGMDGTDLAAEGQWSPSQISFSRLSAQDWGGASIDAAMKAGGTLAQPVLSGSGRVKVGSFSAPALAALYDLLGTPQSWRDYLALSDTADVLIDLLPADDLGKQLLTVAGQLGAGDLNLRAEFADGIQNYSAGQLRVTAGLEGPDAFNLTRQLGFGDAELFADESMLFSVRLEGSAERLDSRINASSGHQSIGFGGVLSLEGADIHGDGTLDVTLDDATGLAAILGSQGLILPALDGSADLHFEGNRLARVSNISGRAAGVGMTGQLSLTRTGDTAMLEGALDVDALSVEGLAGTIFGPAALVAGDALWPEGPIALGDQPRTTRGSVSMTAAAVHAGAKKRLDDASFEITWDDTKTRLARFSAAIGGGTLNLDLTICCSGPLINKTLNGRLSLAGVALDSLASPALAAGLAGKLGGGISFEATGASLAELASELAGEGNFALTDLVIQQLSPQVFPAAAKLDDVLNMDADTLDTLLSLALGQGAFTVPSASGAFTIAGGVVRLASVILESPGARLVGDINLTLAPLALNGGFAMTPVGLEDPNGLVGSDTARIQTRLGGTLLEPVVTVDLSEMVATMQVRANELELDRLEAMRAADAERQRAAAQERNRLIEEQRRRAAEAAALKAKEEADRLAAEEAARRLTEEQFGPPMELLPSAPTRFMVPGYQFPN